MAIASALSIILIASAYASIGSAEWNQPNSNRASSEDTPDQLPTAYSDSVSEQETDSASEQETAGSVQDEVTSAPPRDNPPPEETSTSLSPAPQTSVTYGFGGGGGGGSGGSKSKQSEDTTAPNIVPPSDIVYEATGALTIVAIAPPEVTDSEDPDPDIINDAPSEGFPLGTTVVTWTATDDAGNSRSASQTVTVHDTRPPAITAPADIIRNVDNGTELAVLKLGIPKVRDAADSKPAVTNNAPRNGFPVGNTTVTWTARDASGNSAKDTQKITIVLGTPEPAPTPPSAWKGLHGANLIDPVLRAPGSQKVSSWSELDTMINTANAADFNVFRVVVRWNSYVDNEQNFLRELDRVAQKTNDKGIKIWVENHHFFVTSYWNTDKPGNGFPKYVVDCYNPTKDYNHDLEVLRFWDDYYANKIKDPAKGCKSTMDVWTEQAKFMKAIIAKIDKYPNVLGYEILNEPHVMRNTHYDGLGAMHTEVGKQMRQATDKTIVFTREVAWGYHTSDGTKYDRKVNLEHKILPRITGDIRYIPHLYDLESIDRQLGNWIEFQDEWKATVDLQHPSGYNVGLGLGEFALQPEYIECTPEPSCIITEENMAKFISEAAIKDAALSGGFPITYWSFGEPTGGMGEQLTFSDGTLTKVGRLYRDAIVKFY